MPGKCYLPELHPQPHKMSLEISVRNEEENIFRAVPMASVLSLGFSLPTCERCLFSHTGADDVSSK